MKRKVANPNPQIKKLNHIDKKLSGKEIEIEIEEEIEIQEEEKKHPNKPNNRK